MDLTPHDAQIINEFLAFDNDINEYPDDHQNNFSDGSNSPDYAELLNIPLPLPPQNPPQFLENLEIFENSYRKLNQLTKRSTYYLPRIQSILDEVSGKKYFSVADCSSGFFHIKLAKGHEERSAFICHMGLFEWLRCPFGLAGALTTFQRAMEEVRQMCSATFLVYLDDCIIGSMTEDEHLRDINTFLKTMTEVGFRLKPEKCRFALGEIRYLGHLISANGVRIDPKDLEPIHKLRKPKTITELRSLIGMLSYFRNSSTDLQKYFNLFMS